MFKTRQLVLSAVCVLALLGGEAAAQNSGGVSARREPAPFAASVSDSGARFAAPAGAASLRLEVYGGAGELLYDSGFRQGAELLWEARDLQGAQMADGSYRVRLSAQFASGETRQAEGSVSVAGGRPALAELSPQALALSSEATPAPAAAGVGTSNRISKWLDGAGTLGDSVITETASGHVGVSNPNPSTKLVVTASTGAEMRFDKGALSVTPVLSVISQPGSTTTGAALTLGAGTEGSSFVFSDNKPFYIVRDTKANVVNNNLGFGTPVFTLTPAGRVGIGVTSPSERLEVAGSLRLTGAGGAVVFPDGSRQTTAASSGGATNGTSIISAINAGGVTGTINSDRLPANVVRLDPSAPQVSESTTLAPDGTNMSLGIDPMIDLSGSYGVGTRHGTFRVNHDGGFLVAGEFDNTNPTAVPAEGVGVRMMWYPRKAAFRAGGLNTGSVFDHSTGGTSISSGTQWDDANIGLYSVAFGENVRANSDHSVAFGKESTAAGSASFAAGEASVASGAASVALGYHAHTNARQGSFVFSDRSAVDSFRAGASNSASWRVSGGFRIFTASNLSSGVTIQSGASTSNWGQNGAVISTSTGAFLSTGGVWMNASSRALKTDFAAVDARTVLRRVIDLPVLTWRYKSEAASVRHMGPMSQDFNRLFSLGPDDRAIGTVDADGVALAAIQGLNEELKDRDAKISHLEAQVERQQTTIEALRQLVCSQHPTAEVCK